MVDQTAINTIENRFHIRVPESVRLFYKFPAYALYLRAHYDTDVFIEPHLTGENPTRPLITTSAYPPWIAIGESPCTGMLLMVQLDSPVTQVAWRYSFIDRSPDDYTFPNTFEDWLLTGTDRLLSENTTECIQCVAMGGQRDA